jgi:hypothetical protein
LEAPRSATESEAEDEAAAAALRRERCWGTVLPPLLASVLALLVLYGGSPISDAHLPNSSRVLPFPSLSLSLSLSLGMWLARMELGHQIACV